MWEYIDLGEAAKRLRDHPEVDEIAAVRSPDGRLYVLVQQQGFVYGPVLRDIVLDEVGTDEPDVATAVVREVPRIGDTDEVDVAAAVALARRTAEESRWVFRIEPAETPDEAAVVALVCEVLGARRVSMTDSLTTLGADSLVLVELSAAITERFGVTLMAIDLFEVEDVRELERLIARYRSAKGPR